MWGLFIGIGLGLLQVLLLRKTITLMLGNTSNGPIIAVVITILKLAAILGVLLWLAFGAGLEPMLWAAGAMVVVMIGLSVYINIKRAKKEKREAEK